LNAAKPKMNAATLAAAISAIASPLRANRPEKARGQA
jgi:hypothetical protein